MKVAHIDFECRSKVDLKASGASRYAIDPSTEIFMAGVSRGEPEAPIHLWINPRFATADMLGENEEAEEILAEADILTAHSAPFEIAVTWGAAEKKAVSPFKVEPPLSKWRCTAAMARRAGLPWSLEEMAKALNLKDRKDARGKTLIRFFCIPRKKDGKFNEPKDFPKEWAEFCAYCVTDVVVEKQGDHKLKAFALHGMALEGFQFDLRMNQRGIPVNVTALRNAKRIIDEVEETVTRDFVNLTGVNPTQRERVRLLIGLPDMQAETVAAAIKAPEAIPLSDYELAWTRHLAEVDLGITEEKLAPREVFINKVQVLELYSKLSYAAIKKVKTMLDWVCPDDVMRGVFLWHGASTGRWTSRGPQLQNAKKATKELRPLTKAAYAAMGRGISAEGLSLIYGEPYEVIASSVRHFVHKPPLQMLDADFNAIEARVACWIAGEKDILQAWKDGVDLYKRAAAFVFGVPESQIGKDEKRDFGKVLELAAQYGLGTDGFIRTCDNWGIPCSQELAERGIHEYYRPTHPKIVDRWWFLDGCMKRAIARPGETHGPFIVRTIAGIKFLLLKLPSGRHLAFPHPEVNRRAPTVEEKKQMAAGKNFPESRFLEITFWGQLFASTQWGRVRMWGALAFQNEVQAIAADFITHGAIVAEKRGMPPFMLVHDQALALLLNGRTAKDFEEALGDLPAWAKNFPLRVESHVCDFYSK